MKKIIKALAALFTVSILFSGCFNPVFWNIEKEVPLLSGSVSGTINSILHFGDQADGYVVTSNGSSVYYKQKKVERDGDVPVWKKRGNDTFTSVKFSYDDNKYVGQYIAKLAADNARVYALTFEVKESDKGEVVPKKYHLYYTENLQASDWTEIADAETYLSADYGAYEIDDARDIYVKAGIFCTNAEVEAERKAYFRTYEKETKKYSYYELGTSLTSVTPVAGDSTEDVTETAMNSVVYHGGSPIFFSGSVAIAGSDRYFFTNSSKVKQIFMKVDDEAEARVIHEAGSKVISMALTNDYFIYGTGNTSSLVVNDGGISHIKMDRIKTEQKVSATDTFVSNADAVMTTSYQVRALLVEDSSKNEADAIIFSGISFKSSGGSIAVSFENKGLWAYYPSRGNWNRE